MNILAVIPQNLSILASPTFAGLTVSGLTSGRIPYSGTGGLLKDKANLAFNESTNVLTVDVVYTGGCYDKADTTTYFLFSPTFIMSQTNVEYLRFTGGKVRNLTINNGAADIDVFMKTATENLFALDCGNKVINIGDGGTTNYCRISNTGSVTLAGSAALTVAALSSLNGGVSIPTTEDIQFRDSAITIASLNDGHLDITTDGFVDLNTPTIVHNSIVQKSSGSKTLTDASPVSIIDIALAAGESIGGHLDYVIYATDGTELQVHSGSLTFAAVDVGGTLTSDIDEVYLAASETNANSAGTLTDAWSIVDGVNKISIAVNANSSLTNPSITVKYTVKLYSLNTITLL